MPVAIGFLAVGGLYYFRDQYASWGSIAQGVYIEMSGGVFDIFIFGFVLAFFVFKRDRSMEVKRLQEEIDDFKKWNSEEGRFRIAGAIRRSNRLGKTAIDFGGLEISDFSFKRHDIKSIAGSSFYDGTWGTMGSRDQVSLTNIDFSWINCTNVVFSKFNPFAGFGNLFVSVPIKDCSFINCDLSGAVFNGAQLEWSREHPKELGGWHDDGDGHCSFEQKYYSPFDNADLNGASFEDTIVINADFRNVHNILTCNFSGAKRLDTCLFDNDQIKAEVLKLTEKG